MEIKKLNVMQRAFFEEDFDCVSEVFVDLGVGCSVRNISGLKWLLVNLCNIGLISEGLGQAVLGGNHKAKGEVIDILETCLKRVKPNYNTKIVCDGCRVCPNFNRELNTCGDYGSRRASSKNTVTVDGKAWCGFNGETGGTDDSYPSSMEVPKVCFDDFAKPYFVKDKDYDMYVEDRSGY